MSSHTTGSGRGGPAPADPAPERAPAAGGHRRYWAPLALAWSAGAVLLALCWAAGLLPHPFGDRGAVGIGAVLNAFDPLVGTSFTLVLGAIGVVFAAALARSRNRAALRAGAAVGWLTTGVIVLVPLHGALLTLFGYLPVVVFAGWTLPGLPSRYVEVVSEPGSLFLLYCLAGAVLWGMAAQTGARAQRGACPRCGRPHGWTGADERRCRTAALRTGRIAVAAGVAAALAYPAIRIPWIFGHYPGFSAAEGAAFRESGMAIVGIGLGLAGLGGAVLMLGLVQRWGVRFPFWMAGLAGRRVPVPLAVVPAGIVTLALLAMGKGILVGWLDETLGGGSVSLASAPGGHGLLFLVAFPVWGVALAVGTAAYALRRRAECGACGRGLPEPDGVR
ncbi:hypothetical protein [Nocardiopsis potens]|uniref:hypothetical protein n=1 Tax=Nocardiopsis potens TaxID=1246458 RepID=UPI00034DCE0C|nr:hypothetical protein [Nocardiopsis potens]